MKPIRLKLLNWIYQLKNDIVYSERLRGKNFLISILDKLIGKPRDGIIVKTLHGFKLFISPLKNKGVDLAIFKTGTYELGTLHILSKLVDEGSVFYDIGANIGLMSLFVAEMPNIKAKVYSFEPEPQTFEILKKNVALNNCTNISVYPYALGDKAERAKIYSNIGVNRGAASLIVKDSEDFAEVNVMRLDDLVKGERIPIPDIIKIDVEGYELKVLKGATKILNSSNTPILCLEYSVDVDKNVSDLYYFVKNTNRYRIFKFEKWKGFIGKLVEVNNLEEMPSNDNVFCIPVEKMGALDKGIFQA